MTLRKVLDLWDLLAYGRFVKSFLLLYKYILRVQASKLLCTFVNKLHLSQLYLDMKFVICFASQGRYLSRNLHRGTNEIISKALAAFTATGMDPYRYVDFGGILQCL